MHKYFYDTEFLDDGKTINMISIGIVCDDGREYYAINHDAPWDSIRHHKWLCENVVPHLPLRWLDGKPGGKVTKVAASNYDRWNFSLDFTDTLYKPRYLIANEVRDFITHHSSNWRDNALWVNYGAYDHVVLAQLWGSMTGLPAGIPMFSRDLQQLWWDAGCPEKPPQPKDDHHALADAKYNMALWQTCVAFK
jgi:hypothetical protein